ncbi:unnamed protein product, partial [Amoebophrya sp. A120]
CDRDDVESTPLVGREDEGLFHLPAFEDATEQLVKSQNIYFSPHRLESVGTALGHALASFLQCTDVDQQYERGTTKEGKKVDAPQVRMLAEKRLEEAKLVVGGSNNNDRNDENYGHLGVVHDHDRKVEVVSKKHDVWASCEEKLQDAWNAALEDYFLTLPAD